MIDGELKWVVIDLTTGKLDGFYLFEDFAAEAMKSWAETWPDRQFVVAEIHRAASNKLILNDRVWLGTERV
jgi:hypothetical protein